MKKLFFAVFFLALVLFGSFAASSQPTQNIAMQRTWDALCAQYGYSEEIQGKISIEKIEQGCLAADVDGDGILPDCEWVSESNSCRCNAIQCPVLDGQTYPQRPPPVERQMEEVANNINAFFILFFVLTLPGALVGAFFGSASKSLAKKVPNRLARTALLVVGAAILLVAAISFFSFFLQVFLLQTLFIFYMGLDFLLVTFLPNIAALFTCFFIFRRQNPSKALWLQFLLAVVILFIAFSAIFVAVGLI